MKKAGIIYKITNTINGKTYIGQTTQKMNKRWGDHCSNGATCKAISSAIKKYGKSAFKIDELLTVFNKKDLNLFEAHFIKQFNSFGLHGYNLSNGGENDGSAVLKKPVIGYNFKTNTSFYLNCINHGSRYKFDPRAIQKCLKYTFKAHHNYLWFYIDNFTDENLENRIDYILKFKESKSGSSSKYRGVSWSKKAQKWYAGIKIKGKSYNLGFYDTEIEAHDAYLKRFLEK